MATTPRRALSEPPRPHVPARAGTRSVSSTLPAVGAAGTLEGCTVLIVESAPDARERLLEAAARAGARAIAAADPGSAAAVVGAIVLDAVVCALEIAEGPGRGFLEWLDAERSAARIARVIVASERERLEVARRWPRARHVPRPPAPDAVVRALSDAIDRR